MKKVICKNYEEMSREAAKLVAAQIKEKPSSILGFATGSSPVGMYKELVRMNKAGEIDFSDITTFNLDEYYPIKRSNDQSYYYFMFDNLFSHVNIKKENVNVPNGEVSDPDAECRAYDEKIESYGGIDLQVLGIGHNGHIGFNEPDDKLIGATHRTGLTESTFHANSGYFEKPEDMPREALTMGLTPIMQAKKIVMVISGKSKAPIVKRMFDGLIGTDCPASVLHMHKDVTVFLDEDAASML
ncbi:MAG: glucosamine-6-phosphate deaminase [Oscillospiraceae bacterium]|nr:glucosamine-6-phosphate deaminase [Oscillospiraceae bacterium]MBQ2742542.1 glucosamine-6-phosphate deaminase [Oscillospiraceae bacterium]MBQ3224925.1 glucosamine-6-phosphate deaminase [Oscillospiraceae bacterium]MBQ6697432.1 glucosamine-6-phosphate deaminase [Oscillospiraceae bacterium]MBQ7054569.1 glucosamine-6-phosphate deaminase [Oscillospiraceae bacterium]